MSVGSPVRDAIIRALITRGPATRAALRVAIPGTSSRNLLNQLTILVDRGQIHVCGQRRRAGRGGRYAAVYAYGVQPGPMPQPVRIGRSETNRRYRTRHQPINPFQGIIPR